MADPLTSAAMEVEGATAENEGAAGAPPLEGEGPDAVAAADGGQGGGEEEPVRAAPPKVGDRMEVTSTEEGLIGSWYEVEVLSVEGDNGRALVTYTAYPDNEQEWVELSRLRPVPPATPLGPTPPAWTRRLTKGDMVELSYESGWWEVQYLGRTGATLRVLAVRYAKVHEVSAGLLRPGWKHDPADGTWTLPLSGQSRTVDQVVAMLHKPANSHRKVEPALAPAAPAGGDAAAAAPAAGEASYKWGVAVEVPAEIIKLSTARGTASLTPWHQVFVGGAPVRAAAVSVGDELSLSADEPPAKVLTATRAWAPGWNPAEVVKVPDEKQLVIAYISDAAHPPTATFDVAQVRPAPPAAPAGWAANLRPGETADVYRDDAWWEVTVDSRKGGKAKVRLAHANDADEPLDVKLSTLRPRFTWSGWEMGWTYASEGGQLSAPSGPMPPRAHVLPTAGSDVSETTRGRTVVRPKSFGDASASAPALSRTASMAPPPYDEARVPKMGELVQVEVAEEEGGAVSWKPAEVMSVVGGGRFTAMVNGEEDFIEEFGMEDEDKEWRKVAAADILKVQKANEAAKKVAKEAMKKLAEEEAAQAAAAAKAGQKRKADDAGGKKDAKKAAPAPAAPPFRFGFGMEVEVKGHEPCFEGSWYAAEVISAKDDSVTVQYDDLYEGPAAKVNYKQEVSPSLLRPVPAPAAADWSDGLQPGAGLELRHDDGWWQVKLVSRQVGAPRMLVASTHWGTQHLVDIASLRPGWRWTAANGGEWSVVGTAARAKKARSGGSGGGSGKATK